MGFIKYLFFFAVPGLSSSMLRRYTRLNLHKKITNKIVQNDLRYWTHNYFRFTDFAYGKTEKYIANLFKKKIDK